MRLLVHLLSNSDDGRRLYADFRQYYGIDLKEMYRQSSTLTPPDIAALMTALPQESRTNRWLTDDPWTENEHLLLEAMNTLRGIEYWVSCNIAMKVKDFKKAIKNAPDPVEHPTMRPKVKPKRTFVSGKEAQARIEAIAKKK